MEHHPWERTRRGLLTAVPVLHLVDPLVAFVSTTREEAVE